MQKRAELLIQRVEHLVADGVPRRRVELVQLAAQAGYSREEADQIYDLAEEEGVDPTFAFELVLIGIGVRELAPPDNDQWVETQVEAPPFWVGETEPSPDAAARERHMRTTFRRLRRMFEQHVTPLAAVQAFTREPDVADLKY
jgi:hypothetical protein